MTKQKSSTIIQSSLRKREVSNLKYLTQLIITGIVLWVSSIFFSNYVIIDSIKTLFLITIACSVISAFLSIIIVGTLLTLLVNEQYILTIIISLFSSIIVNYISIFAAETYISGFQITSVILRLIISIILAFTITRITTDMTSY